MSVSSDSAGEASYNNFAATSTTNYMTTARHQRLAEVSSSNSSANMQSSAREGLLDDASKNGNGNKAQAQSSPSSKQKKKKAVRMLRVRRTIIMRQRKQIAVLQNEVEVFKQVLTQMSADGLLTESYRQRLESNAPDAARLLKDLAIVGN